MFREADLLVPGLRIPGSAKSSHASCASNRNVTLSHLGLVYSVNLTRIPIPLSLEDKIDLLELPGRYGDAMDDRNWPALAAIFTQDATFDVPHINAHMVGLEGIVSFMDENEHLHPAAHLMTNIHTRENETGVELRFRGILPRNQKQTDGSATILHGSYYDQVVKTPAGWRVKTRIFLIERRDRQK